MNVRLAAAAAALAIACGCALRNGRPRELARVWDAEKSHTARLPPLLDQKTIESAVTQLPPDLFTVREAGKSFEGRAIYHVKAGSGPMPVLLWSQMHGDEPTATAALLDVFAYLDRHRNDPVPARILKSLTLHFVPMLNPDGAERFQRRNAQGIDINRDALHLVTPEGQLLKRLRDELNPAVGFNLHNQSWRTSIGTPARPASISLLSVAYDEARTVNAGRLLTKKLGAVVRNALEPLAGDRIGKYDDSFEVRAFGDNLTLWGTPVLLIETGPWPAPEPDEPLVRLNFVAIISALDALATGSVHDADPARYDSLPMNDSGLAHTLIRGGQVLRGDGTPPFRADVSLTVQRRVGVTDGKRQLRIITSIDDLGDLRTTGAMFGVDVPGWLLAPAAPLVPANGALFRNQLIELPDWTADNRASSILEPGSNSGVVVLRPLGGKRYCVEHVYFGTVILDIHHSN